MPLWLHIVQPTPFHIVFLLALRFKGLFHFVDIFHKREDQRLYCQRQVHSVHIQLEMLLCCFLCSGCSQHSRSELGGERAVMFPPRCDKVEAVRGTTLVAHSVAKLNTLKTAGLQPGSTPCGADHSVLPVFSK